LVAHGDDGQGHSHNPEKVVSKISEPVEWTFRTPTRDVEAGVIHQQIEAPFALDNRSDCRF
jgi:hypothetical protein